MKIQFPNREKLFTKKSNLTLKEPSSVAKEFEEIASTYPDFLLV